jgi:hypothetical protein
MKILDFFPRFGGNFSAEFFYSGEMMRLVALVEMVFSNFPPKSI